jgi:hypothetical protein
MIFAREVNDPLTGLVKKVDEINEKHGKKMGSFVVYCSDEEGLKEKLEKLAKDKSLTKTVLTIDNPAGPEDYHIEKDAEVTVILYVNRKVKVNRAYKKGEFKAEEIDKIVADLPKILPE